MVHLDDGGQAGELCICLCVCVLVAIALSKWWDTISCVFTGDCHLQHTISYVIISKSKKGGRKGAMFCPGEVGSCRICRFMARLLLCPKPTSQIQAAAADSLR